MKIDVSRHTDLVSSTRAKQVSAMFDVPGAAAHDLRWRIDAPLDAQPWSVGLIVGPSGSGKSSILADAFGTPTEFDWNAPSVVDAFSDADVQRIADVCMAVGFNTIPAWLRPYGVLSNGEQFRVNLARALLETPDDEPVLIDEFTSVVDRQVAKIGAHAAQKYVRRAGRQMIVATCHYDVIDWLQPDWIIDAADQSFTWRTVQPRPTIEGCIQAVPYSVWARFAPYHYLTGDLHRGARCFALIIDGQPVSFAAIMRRPHPKVRNIMGFSRIVTLPDWQGLGLAYRLADTIASAYKVVGERVRTYPAHPAFIRGHDRSPAWALKQRPGYQGGVGATTSKTTITKRAGNTRGVVHGPNAAIVASWRHGSRPCAVFEYVGPAHPDPQAAADLLTQAHGRPARILPRYRDTPKGTP